MSLLTIILVAIALGADAFSLSIGLGMGGITKGQIYIMSATVLVFHIVMPVVGVYAGGLVGTLVGRAASIAGALVLLYLGFKMLYGAFKQEEQEGPNVLLANTMGIIFLAGSVSMDALSVGFSLGTQRSSLGMAPLIIGVVAGMMTLTGLLFGQRVGNWVGEKAVILGGVILVGIGIRLFF